MSILSDLKNRLFQKESIKPITAHNNYSFQRYAFNTNQLELSYDTGMAILKDITVSMAYDSLKYFYWNIGWKKIYDDNEI